MSKENLSISIVICTYNGVNRIKSTLDHIAALDVPAWTKVELIIVDNNSNDNTSLTAEKYWRHLNNPIPFIITTEERSGVLYARKKGIEVAKGDLILFCDDDNWLASDYLVQIERIFSQNPSIAACGGFGIPHCEIRPPEWFDSYSNCYGCGKQGITEGPIDPRYYLYTAGLVIRKQIMTRVYQTGFKHTLQGRKGNALSAGEDTELTFFIKILGYPLWFSPKLRFKHFIPRSRLNFDYLIRLLEGISQANAYIIPYRIVYLGLEHTFKGRWFYQFFKVSSRFVAKSRKMPLGRMRKAFVKEKWSMVKYLIQLRPSYKSNINNILTARNSYLSTSNM